jgi:hypothetical protein
MRHSGVGRDVRILTVLPSVTLPEVGMDMDFHGILVKFSILVGLSCYYVE